jgi:hypothetical protein
VIRILLILAVIALFAAAPLAAQSDEACTPQSYAALLSAAAEALGQPDADPESQLALLITQIQNQRAACAGLSFSKSGSVVAGPIELPAGTYIASADLSNFGVLTFDTVTDACRSDVIGLMMNALDMSGGQAEVVLRTEADCTFLVAATTTGPWTLIFTPVQ